MSYLRMSDYAADPGRYDAMTYRFCGRSGLQLPLISLGLWQNFGDDKPFDGVVCSLVLCSVDRPEDVLRQLYTQLKPGGELRYFEHIASSGARGGLQRLADATLWPRLFGNCHTHRDTERTIAAAGFVIDAARRQPMMPRWSPLPAAEFALGRAVKPR